MNYLLEISLSSWWSMTVQEMKAALLTVALVLQQLVIANLLLQLVAKVLCMYVCMCVCVCVHGVCMHVCVCPCVRTYVRYVCA